MMGRGNHMTDYNKSRSQKWILWTPYVCQQQSSIFKLNKLSIIPVAQGPHSPDGDRASNWTVVLASPIWHLKFLDTLNMNNFHIKTYPPAVSLAIIVYPCSLSQGILWLSMAWQVQNLLIHGSCQKYLKHFDRILWGSFPKEYKHSMMIAYQIPALMINAHWHIQSV